MDASQKYIEGIDTYYEFDDSLMQDMQDMADYLSIPIAVLIECNAYMLPMVEGYTQKIGGVLKYSTPYFFEVEYIHEPKDFPIFINVNKIDCDTYLDYVSKNQTLKSNEAILQRVYTSQFI
tara:strand:- start:175 stop:537 length:363 start_codon:yes stop_codon:yes gene_type:complete